MNLSKLEKEVPFDQFSRQFQVQEIIQAIKKEKSPFTILDVGGYKGRTNEFLSLEKVTVLDLYDIEEKSYVKGDALDLPFDNNSFDFVVSFDVLEHIPQTRRPKFLSECFRVAKKGAIICAPNKTVENEATELALNNLYKKLHKKNHQWLKEHIEYGIPDFDLIQKDLDKKGLFTVRFYSNKTQLWFAMQQAIFINSKFPIAAEELNRLNEFYNKNFKYDGGGTASTSYRQILCGLKDLTSSNMLNTTMKNINEPIKATLEIELLERINQYYSVLIEKTTQLAKNYEELYIFNKNEAERYEKINTHLMAKVHKYEKILPISILRRTKAKISKAHK